MWGGVSQPVLITVFNCFIRPAFNNRAEHMVTVSEKAASQLGIIQNSFLLFISGARILTPIVGMQLQTFIALLTDRWIYVALILHENTFLRKDSFLVIYVISPPTLKTRDSFLHAVRDLQGSVKQATLLQDRHLPTLFDSNKG